MRLKCFGGSKRNSQRSHPRETQKEARQLMLDQHMTAGAASAVVGYESASQFNREYLRLSALPSARHPKDAVTLKAIDIAVEEISSMGNKSPIHLSVSTLAKVVNGDPTSAALENKEEEDSIHTLLQFKAGSRIYFCQYISGRGFLAGQTSSSVLPSKTSPFFIT
jgi:hypothetical protein